MDEFASRQYPVQEHMAFQRRTWIVQRAGWLVLALISLAALLGMFGGGILSKRTVGNVALTVEYERFERLTRLAQFSFRFAPAQNSERRLHLSRSFQDSFEITSVQPPPLRSAAAADGLDLVFATAPSAASQVVIWAHSRNYGSIRIDARADDGPPVSFHVFVYP
jgi:hypothetical protein